MRVRRACVRACVRASERIRVRACVRSCVYTCTHIGLYILCTVYNMYYVYNYLCMYERVSVCTAALCLPMKYECVYMFVFMHAYLVP